MIRVQDLSVTFGRGTPNELRALAGVSLEMQAGDFVTVIGSNGAGKSTLLNAIAGDTPVDRGTIRFGTQDVTRQSAHARARLVARVFQDPMAGTCEALSIEENMAIAARRTRRRSWRGAVGNADRAMFRDRLSTLGLGLENRLADRVGLLSGGQRQAVSLLMATLVPSQALLLDEHTAALDPKAAALVLGLTDRLVREARLATLMITHSMRDALAFGDRLLMLHGGKIVFEAREDEKRRLNVADLMDLLGRMGQGAVSDRMALA